MAEAGSTVWVLGTSFRIELAHFRLDCMKEKSKYKLGGYELVC